MSFAKRTADGILMSILVLPRSSKSMIAGIHADALKIKLSAPPVDGAANAQLLKFLAKKLVIPKSSMTITSGATSRNKQVMISILKSGKPLEAIEAAICQLASS